MKVKSLILALVLLVCESARCQSNDSLTLRIAKLESDADSVVYSLSIRNNFTQPIIILHSIFIDLNANVPQLMVPFTSNSTEEEFGLFYSAEDNTMISERILYDGELLMPRQTINFKLSIPQSSKEKSLFLEFITLSDFCYSKLKSDMRKSATWYSSYNRSKLFAKLPN